MQSPMISKELQEKAKNEFNEEPVKLQETLGQLRKWITEQHLKARTDDEWLTCFLRKHKFDLEKTKERINVFYTCKTTMPEFFSNRDPLSAEIQQVLKRKVMIILPKTEGPAGPRLILNRAEFSRPDFVSATNFSKALFMSFDILCAEDPNSQIAGISLIMDLKGMSYKYVKQMTLYFLKNVVLCIVDAYPIHIKGVYFINAPYFFYAIYNLAKIFFSDDLKKLIRFYGTMEDTYKDIPQSVFPNDYGGEQASCDQLADDWKLKLESCREWLMNDEQYCCIDETKHPGKPKTGKK